MLRAESRWLAALTLLWLVVPLGLLRLGADTGSLLEDPPVTVLRTVALSMPAGTAILTFLHARAHHVSRPLARAVLAMVLLDAVGWLAWVWTLEGRRGSGAGLAVPLCLVALVLGALAGSRPADARPATDDTD